MSVKQNYAILDSGCPVSVSGKKWIEKFLNQFGHSIAINKEKENERFKFGSSKTYDSNEKITLNVKIGGQDWIAKVSVIEAEIPLLLGNDFMKKHGISLINDSNLNESYIQLSSGKRIVKNGTGHWKVAIQGKNSK